VIYPVKYFLCLIFSLFDVTVFKHLLYTISFDMAAFNLTGQGMQRNAEVGLFTKTSKIVLQANHIVLPYYSIYGERATGL
jgi:hypothetical protein